MTEDKDHIIQCPVDSTVVRWLKAVTELDNWMQVARTDPQIQQVITRGLQHWHNKKPMMTDQMEQNSASLVQETIGWGLAFEECLATRWHKEQDHYLKAFKSRRSSKRWTTALITCLMNTAWDMWQHQNEALHQEETNQQAILDYNINQEIHQAYEHHHGYWSPGVKTLFHRPLQKLLKLPRYYKKQWMATLRTVQTHFNQQREGLSRGERATSNMYTSQISTAL